MTESVLANTGPGIRAFRKFLGNFFGNFSYVEQLFCVF